MSTIDTSPSNNGRGLEAWSGAWTHPRVEPRVLVARRLNPCLWPTRMCPGCRDQDSYGRDRASPSATMSEYRTQHPARGRIPTEARHDQHRQQPKH